MCNLLWLYDIITDLLQVLYGGHHVIAINSHISGTEQDTMKLFAAMCLSFVALSYVPT